MNKLYGNYLNSTLFYILLCLALLHAGGSLQAKAPDTAFIMQLMDRGYTLQQKGWTDSAYILHKRAIAESHKSQYTKGIIRGNSLAGYLLIQSGDYIAAEQHYQEALHYIDTARSSASVVKTIYNNLAVVQQLLNDYESSIHSFEQAVRYAKEEDLANLYCNMGSIFNNLKQPDKALYYFELAESLANKFRNYMDLTDIWNNKAAAYAIKKDWDNAEAGFRKALSLAKRNGFDESIQLTYYNMGVFALDHKQHRKAIQYLLQAERITKVAYPNHRNMALFSLGRAYIELKHYDSALYYLKKALPLAHKLKAQENLSEVHKYMAHAYAGIGNYMLAYEHRGKEKDYIDSINTKQRAEAVLRIEARFRTAQKDKQIAQKQLTINQQQTGIRNRNIGIGVSVIVLTLLAILLFILRKNYKHKQALENEKMQHLIRQQQMKEMKAIINGEEKERTRIARELHDGIMVRLSATQMQLGTLMGKRQLSITRENLEPIAEDMASVALELRLTAHNLMPDMLLAEGLSEAVYYFCNSIQQGTALSVTFEALTEIPRFEPQFELSVYRIIQELLQNIIKHAEANKAYIQMNYDNKLLIITVEDDGVGMQSTLKEGNKGMGLKSIQARVLSLNGRMELESTPDTGTSVNLEFDLSY